MVSKWIIIAVMTAMLPLAWWLGHNKDADFVNAFCGAVAFYGMILCIIITAFAAPAYLTFG